MNMKLTDKINFNQPKYKLPALIYIPLVLLGFAVYRLFNTEKVEVTTAETTEYYNDKLPAANIKGDGIGDKYTNMLNDFGKIKDESAVENIERGNEKVTEEYESQYSDAEIAAMDQSNDKAKESMERLQKLQEQIRQQQAKDNQFADNREGGNTEEEEETLNSLRQALADARLAGQQQGATAMNKLEDASQTAGAEARNRLEGKTIVEANVTPNEKAVNEIAEDAEAEQLDAVALLQVFLHIVGVAVEHVLHVAGGDRRLCGNLLCGVFSGQHSVAHGSHAVNGLGILLVEEHGAFGYFVSFWHNV